MKATIKRKVIGLAMSLAMACTMMPQLGMTAYGAEGDSAMVIGTGVLESTSNTANAQTVYMADIPWRVIGYGSSGVASSENTMTMLSAGILKTDVVFREYINDEGSDSWYHQSILQSEVEAIANTFSAGEQAGIATRKLKAGDYNGYDTDTVSRYSVSNARLWPLSTKEAYYTLNGYIRNVNDFWWLRSPGYTSPPYFTCHISYVKSDGNVDEEGCLVTAKNGVRPAFNYKLNSVIFTSAATGGKSSGTVGADALNAVGTYGGSEWKLTVKSGHDNFKVDSVTTCDGKTLNIKYSGAATGNNEYISAIIKNSEGNVTYYGNLKNCAAESDASGIAKVKVEEKLGEGDTLHVFNEQLNGDKKTDLSSELKEVTIPQSAGHSMTHHAAVAPTCTEDGNVEYWSCEKCSINFEDEQGTKKATNITVPKTGHNMTHHDAVAPTCTTDGNVEYWSCENCSKNFGDAQGTNELETIVDPKGHKLTHHDAKSPTCTEDGTVEYWSCGNCSKNFSDEQGTNELETIVDPKGHKLTHHAAVAPTCTEDGNVEYWSCGNCNKNFSDEQGTTELTTTVDPKTGHNMTHHAAVAHKCTEDGTVEYWSCGNCNKNFSDEQGTTELTTTVDPKTGHNMTHHDAVAPKCTEDGTVEYWSCGNCNKNFSDEQGTTELTSIVDPATGHTWDEGEVTKEPTITEEGVRTYTCTVCKAKEDKPIAKLPKKENTLKIKAKTTKVKYKKLKKKTRKLAVTKVIKFTDKGQGKMTYKLLSAKKGKKSFKKYIKINKTTGKVTIKKNKKMKKGTYKVKIRAKAAGNAEYKASGWKTVTFKIKVK